ncbi:MAG: patatin-like phospholipase family protein [Rubrivivax sp.]|uniref:patatin-like phospholipase family protein n=1 Tax=Ottowia sp. TaxID=1898956 RepID=UPI0011DC48F8|nr:patatin-like phospholipase family protein [Ottowia sp.]MCC6813365.1 patatin-like phospholipase family protein [Rubrivivax sp.]TXI22979.1 MAG: patatin family protein [Ottowia sp.]HNR82134.1 patatin-like phospholipase family protein [Ottowia sp.]HNT84493.1 patatin-like phospholipase family protein [Ottowia sp.]HOZ93565.1 patatin-like phospholipase family protein [Ottowia sp.]
MSKIGLALAGGGPLGGIYEVGACVALEEAIDGLSLVDADVYVGVSAGSFVAASLANGFEPRRLARMLLGSDGSQAFDPSLLLRPALREYLNRARAIPRLALQAAREYLGNPWRHGLFESFQRLSRAIPTGLFDGAGVDAVLRRQFSEVGRSNDFRRLKARLYVVATDLDSGQAVAFGGPGRDDVPISTAVQASAALPGLFPPVEIQGRHYVDGALIKTLHASVALRDGVDLLLCVNPLVPFDAQLAEQHGAGHRQLSEGGLPVVLAQTFRAIIRSRMRVGMDRYQHQFKHADVLLFEPAQDDEAMFFANLFSYRDRARLCEHAYQRTREHLYQRRDELAPVLARHGLQLNLEVLRDRTRTLLGAEPAATATQGLARTLDQLQHWIDARRAA